MRVTDVVYDEDEPVSEERARALAVEKALNGALSEFLDKQRRRIWWVLGSGGCVTVLGFALLMSGSLFGLVVVVLGFGLAGGGYYYIQNQQPDLQIEGLKKGYWTGLVLPSEDGVLLYDTSDTIPKSEFHLNHIPDKDKLTETRSGLEKMNEFPIVMTDEENLEGEFTNMLESVESQLKATESITVEAPVLSNESPELQTVLSLIDHADSEPVATEHKLDVGRAEADVEALSALHDLARENPVAKELETVKETSQKAAEDLSDHQDEAVETLNNHIQSAADTFGIVSYNFYCAECQEDDIESQLTVSEDSNGNLYCETCRSSQSRAKAIPRHKIKDDIIIPIWDQLWTEKADERRKIYENIEDKKQELRENEYQQFREEVRTTTERIRDIRSKVRDLRAHVGDRRVETEEVNEEGQRALEETEEETQQETETGTQQLQGESLSQERRRRSDPLDEDETLPDVLQIEEDQRQAELLTPPREMHDNIAQAHAELEMIERVMEGSTGKSQIQIEQEQIENVRHQLRERLTNISERYEEKYAELDRKADLRVRNLGSHIFSIVEDEFGAGIEDPFTRQVTPVWQNLQTHNEVVNQQREMEVIETTESVVEEIDSFLDRNEELLEHIDDHILDPESIPVETAEVTEIQLPYYVVEYERDGASEQSTVPPSEVVVTDETGGWCTASLEPIHGADNMVRGAIDLTSATEETLDKEVVTDTLSQYTTDRRFGPSYVETIRRTLPDTLEVQVEGGEG